MKYNCPGFDSIFCLDCIHTLFSESACHECNAYDDDNICCENCAHTYECTLPEYQDEYFQKV